MSPPLPPGITRLQLAIALNKAIPLDRRPPTPADDAAAGYAVGDFWNGSCGIFRALSVTAGAARWQEANIGVLPADVTASAIGIYGTRRLRAAYGTGAAIDVQRASDSGTLTVAFAADGSLDTAALDAFGLGTTVRVSKWYDQTGNGRHATQATFANMPAITPSNKIGCARSIVFDTTINPTVSNPKTLALPSTLTTGAQALSVVFLGRVASASRPVGLVSLADSTAPAFPMEYGFSPGSGMAVNFGGLRSFAVTPPLTPAVFGYTSSGSAITQFLNNATATGSAAAVQTLAGGTIGSVSSGFTANGYFEAAAFLVFNTALSTAADLPNVKASLHSLFHTVPQVRNFVAFDGDSITEGAQSTFLRSYPRRAAGLLTLPCTVYDCGYYGHTLQQQASAYSAYVAPAYVGGARNNVVMIAAGSNDLAAYSLTAAQVWASAQSYCQQAKATGFKVIIATVLPRSDLTVPQKAEWTAYNALVRANAGTYRFDAVADFQADAAMGPFEAAVNGTLYADGIHPTDLGYSYLAPIAAAAVNSVLV